MSKNLGKKKVFLILIYIIYLLFLVEIFLRIAGICYSTIVAPRADEGSLKDENAFRILCIGDSCTYGVGAPSGKSYPSQLYKLLNEKAGTEQFCVINRGVPGLNSSQALRLVKHFVPLYKPDVLLFLCGHNDFWNLEDIKLTENERINPLEYSAILANIYLSNLRIYKLYQSFFLTKFYVKNFINIDAQSNNVKAYAEWEDEENYKISKHINDLYVCTPESFSFFAENKRILDIIRTKNIEEVCKVSRRNNAKLFFLSYPDKEINKRAYFKEELLKKYNVCYINNIDLFNRVQNKGFRLFRSDGFHPNELGYYYIAVNIYNAFIDNGIIDAEKIKLI